jgi:hypothetical protein
MTRKAVSAAFALLLGLALSGCSWFGSPKYYERTKKFTKEKMEASRSFAERYIERDSLVRVKPWERDMLARPEMGLVPDPAESLRRGHIFFSKEAALGGGSAGGGGCGCN